VEELRAKGAEIAIGPLTRNPGLRLAFVRGEAPKERYMELEGQVAIVTGAGRGIGCAPNSGGSTYS
jgi:hypothetical protein